MKKENKGLRILLVASDIDTVSQDALDQQLESITSILDEEASIDYEIKSLRTDAPEVFIERVKEDSPDIIHFTRHGSPNQYVRMKDGGGGGCGI